MKNQNEPNGKWKFNVWTSISLMIVIGLGLVLIIGISVFWSRTDSWATYATLSSVGISLLLAGACFAGGGLTGFLFGIPRVVQNTAIIPEDNIANRTLIVQNDNLVQISDWLTKIIVGVGLTQLHEIPGFISKIGDFFKLSLGGGPWGQIAAIAVVCYFTILGFITVYLWTRLFFINDLAINTRSLNEYNKLKEEKKDLIITSQKIANEELRRKRIGNRDMPSSEFESEILQLDKTKPIINEDDLQRGRWGGKNTDGNLTLEASYDPSLNIGNFYGIRLIVRPIIEGLEFSDEMAFFLHDSFSPEIEFVKPKINIAKLEVVAYEAFVVGARTKSGVELELDLNKVKGFPSDFYW